MFTDPEVIRHYQSCHMFASPACTPQCCDRYAVHWIKFQTKCYLLITTKHGVEMNSVEFSIESETTICIVVSDRIKDKQLLFPYHLYCQERNMIFCANLIDTMAISCLPVPWILASPGHQQTCYWPCRKSDYRISSWWIATTCTVSLPQIWYNIV